MMSGSGTRGLRRLATVTAAVGALLISSGIALMAAPMPAAAGDDSDLNHPGYWEEQGYGSCTKDDRGTEAGGYTMPTDPPGEDTVWTLLVIKKKSGDDAHTTIENPVGGTTYYWNNDPEAEGYSHVITCSDTPEVKPLLAAADVAFTDPDCDNGNVGTYKAVLVDHATLEVVSGTPASTPGTYQPGSSILIRATAADGYEFKDGKTTADIPHTFAPAELNCTIVQPPIVEPPAVAQQVEETTTPTVVSAGLAGDAGANGRDQQGLGLVLAGLLLIAGAGGLVLRGRRVTA